VPFSLTVKAVDIFRQTAVGYTGTVTFTSNDTMAVLPDDNVFFPATDAGSHNFTAFLMAAGTTVTITVSDPVNNLSTPIDVVVI
jgi:hypothetical protein